MKHSELKKYALAIMARYKAHFAGILLLAALTSLLNTSFGAMLKWLSDGLQAGQEDILFYFIALFSFQRLILPLLGAATTLISSRLANKIETDIRGKWHYFVLQPTSDADKGRNSGDYQKRVQEAVFSVRSLLNNSFRSFLMIIFEIAAIAIFAVAFIGFAAGLTLLAFAISYSFFVIGVTKNRLPIMKEIAQSDAQCAGFMHDSFINREASNPNAKNMRNSQHDDLLAILQKTKNKNSKKLFFDSAISSIICFGGVFAILVGFYQSNTLSVGVIVMLATSLAQLIIQVNTIGFNYRSLLAAKIDIERISEGLSITSSKIADQVSHLLEPEINQFDFHCDDIEMASSSSLPAINGTLVLKRGVINTILGSSGIGKSTVARLIRGEISPAKGQIFINGENIQSFPKDHIMSRIGYVSQDNVIYNETIERNLQYAAADVNQSDLAKVLTKVGLENFIEKLNQPVGEKGTLLSGGERQRLVVARGLLQGCDILIVDEPFTGLDDARSKKLADIFNGVADEITLVIITHEAPEDVFGSATRLNNHIIERAENNTTRIKRLGVLNV